MEKTKSDEYPLSELTEKIIGAAFKVHNTIGKGFHEKVYENALVEELKSKGLTVDQQKELNVVYGGKPVGSFVADLLIEENVIVELKAKQSIEKATEDQLVNYLKASGIKVGLIINFGKSVEIRRKIFTR
jgi:GxxExxY protein